MSSGRSSGSIVVPPPIADGRHHSRSMLQINLIRTVPDRQFTHVPRMPTPDGAQGGPLEPEQAGGEPGQAEQADAHRLPIAREELEDAAHGPCLRHTGGLSSGKGKAAPRETARDQEPGAEDMP